MMKINFKFKEILKGILSFSKGSPLYFGFFSMLLLVWAFMLSFVSWEDLKFFPSVMALDMAQIARNLVEEGRFLETNYLLPTGYASLGRLFDHPDFIRYPLPIFVYSILFWVFGPDLALAMQLSTIFVFWLSSLVFFEIFRKIASKEGMPRNVMSGAVLAWILVMIGSLNSLELAFQGAYETYTLLLLMLLLRIGLSKVGVGRALGAGMLCALMWLSRANMLVLTPLVGFALVLSRRSRRVKELGLFVTGFLLVGAPFMLRSWHYTGRLFFSIQSYAEFLRDVEATYWQIYLSFQSYEGSIFSLLWQHPWRVLEKFAGNFVTFLTYCLSPLLGVALLVTGIYVRKKKFLAPLLLFIWLALLLHGMATSFFMQALRIHAPFFGILFALCFTLFIQGLQAEVAKPWVLRCLWLVALVGTLTFVQIQPHRDPQIKLLPVTLRMALSKEEFSCFYASNPVAAAWSMPKHRVLYAPHSWEEASGLGPRECRHYLHDLDPSPLLDGPSLIVPSSATLTWKQGNYELYSLHH